MTEMEKQKKSWNHVQFLISTTFFWTFISVVGMFHNCGKDLVKSLLEFSNLTGFSRNCVGTKTIEKIIGLIKF